MRAPDGGVVDPDNGQPALAYGVIASSGKFSGNPPRDQDPLQLATAKPIESLQQENANIKVSQASQPITVDAERGLSTYLRNDSPGWRPGDGLARDRDAAGRTGIFRIFLLPNRISTVCVRRMNWC